MIEPSVNIADETYPPIADYAIIGDCRSAALIARDGSLDWLCWPHFSSPSIFGALLDARHGGRFRLRPVSPVQVVRRYVGTTPVLETVVTTPTGKARLIDFMPLPIDSAQAGSLFPQRELVRLIEGLEGHVALDVLWQPRPGYGLLRPTLASRGRLGWVLSYGNALLGLQSSFPLQPDPDTTSLQGNVIVRAGQRETLACHFVQGDPAIFLPLSLAWSRLETARAWWTAWSRTCTYQGPYRDQVLRSLVTLKLLTHCLSGSIVAAATTSLPESQRLPGLTWDYRYCWLRDAAMTVRSFLSLGYADEAHAFLDWLLHATRLSHPALQVCYDVYGETHLPERILSHWQGYRGQGPVRVGNEASRQHQLDAYGEVILAAYECVRHGRALSLSERRFLVELGYEVCRRWTHPDYGLWEFRDIPRQYTYSKMMCWVALDRLLALQAQGVLAFDIEPVAREHARIRYLIEQHGFSAALGAYTGVLDTQDLDAGLLLMASYGFHPAMHPRLRATAAVLRRELADKNLLTRYKGEAFCAPGTEGAFVICNFWEVEYLALRGALDLAHARFANLFSLANDVGLLAEEVDTATGEAMGNFPQAFSHVGVITAALTLAEQEATVRESAADSVHAAVAPTRS
ncbi:MAG: glycoside hydrolase family 15 protein [Nitrospirae bacterium]|nr:MAG: glycoside hydrolase family 15 protein [Nitrospirota bacterium]